MGLLRRGGPAPRWQARSLEAGLLRLHAEHARTSAARGEEVGRVGGGWWWISLLLPGAPCAMRARSGRGRRARGRQERRAPPSRTPPRSRTSSSRFYRALCADDGPWPWRTRALLLLQQPPPPSRDWRFPPTPPVVAHLRCGQVDHSNSRGFRREKKLSTHLCACARRPFWQPSKAFSPPLQSIEADPGSGRWTFGPPRPQAVAREQPPSLS